MHHAFHLRSFALLSVLALFQEMAAAEVVEVRNRDELASALRDAKPGTIIRIAPGNYGGGLSQGRLRGTKDQPIIIAGADPDKAPVIEGGGSGLHLSSPAHVELRDLIIAGANGNGLNIDDSGSTDTPAHDLVLRNIVVRDVGPRGNRDGIKLSGVNDFRIEGCQVERWGSSGSAIDMVGCHNGVVKECKFRDAGDSANGVQAKGGSSEILIQHCRFENAGGRAVNIGGSTGLPYFRPKDATCEARNITVEDCEFIGGMSAVAFVGVDGALVQHNTIYRPWRWPVRILQENTEPQFVASRRGRFFKNVVVFRSDEVREVVNIGASTAPESFEFSGNVWHCLDRSADTRRLVRLPVEETAGSYDKNPGLKDAEKGDLSIPGRKPQDAGARAAPTK
ncbi:MAG: right-handed parallel beta-helix repeat-containing protein [Planctomycetaceae bacterium]|nr:right-handed parallel beta-helix repeat-containing protein [Planctomycetaceae bacterium]